MTWNGQGEDPWLTERLDALANAAELERGIRNAFFAALTNWLVQTARRVTRGDAPPDLDAVWARVPAWREAVELVVTGHILKALGAAYRRLLGENDPSWQQRTFVTRYLAEVRNRLVRLPEEVYDLLAGEVAQGINLGEGIPDLAKRVDMTLSTTGSEHWQNRATVVARTETIAALNAGQMDAFRAFAEDEPTVAFEKIWLATADSRTRPDHVEADGQRVPLESPFNVGGFELMFPGDPSGPPQEVIQCRCTMLLVEPGESVAMSDRQMKRSRR